MTETMTALQAFFSGFGLTAYPEDSVPADAQLPYITYMPVRTHGLEAASMQARVWYRSRSYVEVNAKSDEIARAVGTGARLRFPGGMVVLRPGAPLLQHQPIAAPDIKVVYINLQINKYGI